MAEVKIHPTEFVVEGEKLQGAFVTPDSEGLFPGIVKFHGLPGGPNQIAGIAIDVTFHVSRVLV